MISSKKTILLCFFLLLAGLAALTLTSCGAQTVQDQAAPADRGSFADTANVYAAKEGGHPGVIYGQVVGQSQERHVIRNGSLELTVSNTRETVSQVKNIVASAGGIIGSAYIYELKDDLYAAELTLRVPAAQFDPVMDRLQALGKATNVGQSNQDVTMQYIDMEARIKTLHAQEERLREILKMAVKIEEVLQVEKELGRVRSEIEAMTAQFTYLQDQVVFSTINLRIKEEAIATQNISQAPFENPGGRMKAAFVRSINFILSACAVLLVALTAILPVLIVLIPGAAVLWLIITKLISRKPPAA